MIKDNVVIITGAVGNLGLATAQAFQRGGDKTVLVDRSLDRLKRVFADLAASADHLLLAALGGEPMSCSQ